MAGGRTHRPEHDEARCSACAGCSWRCPAAVFPALGDETDSLRGALFGGGGYPGRPRLAPPCVLACPLGQDVPTYVAAIARGAIEAAAAVIRETNALPSACGRLCTASCSRACTRAGIDEGIDIRTLKRFAVETVPAPAPRAPIADGSPSVAIVGGGPAGLSAAHRLVQLGLAAEVFEAGPRAGGLLVDAVPGFALPAARVAADVADLTAQGVKIRTGMKIGVDVPWDELPRQHAAVLVATGAGRGLLPALPGRELDGVTDAIAFCRTARRTAEGDAALPVETGGTVVVLGGGKPALLAARAARRLGAHAIVVHPAPLDLWPAGPGSMEPAREEGVELRAGHRVTALAADGDRLAGVTLQPVVPGATDAVGRVPLRNRGQAEQVAVTVLVAAGDRKPLPEALPQIESLARGPRGNLRVDGSYRLGPPGWYAAGEVATGAASLVDSMATGRRVAELIAADLGAGRPGGDR